MCELIFSPGMQLLVATPLVVFTFSHDSRSLINQKWLLISDQWTKRRLHLFTWLLIIEQWNMIFDHWSMKHDFWSLIDETWLLINHQWNMIVDHWSINETSSSPFYMIVDQWSLINQWGPIQLFGISSFSIFQTSGKVLLSVIIMNIFVNTYAQQPDSSTRGS